MLINTNNLVSITEANQNFSRVARLVDEAGSAIVLKNNVPRYVILEYDQLKNEEQANTDEVMIIAKRAIGKHMHAFEELGK